MQIRGAVFVLEDGYNDEGIGLVAIKSKPRFMREDPIRLPNGNADLRYRPCYMEWSATLSLELDPDVLSAEQVHHLVQRAGFAVGIHEHRPQKNGDWGRFELSNTKKAA